MLASRRKIESIFSFFYRKNGEVPYIVPLGGSNITGTFGIIRSFQELLEQVCLPKYYIYENLKPNLLTLSGLNFALQRLKFRPTARLNSI